MDHSSWPEFLIVKFGDFHHEGLALLEHPQKSKTVVENRELRPTLSSILQSFFEWILTYCFLIDPSQAEAHLDDIRFNSNWIFFTNDDCLKVNIQFQMFLKIPKFGLTEGVIFNSENGKLSWAEKWWYRQISEMGGENSKNFFCIASCGLLPTLKKKFRVPRPPRPTGHRCKVGKVGSRFW